MTPDASPSKLYRVVSAERISIRGQELMRVRFSSIDVKKPTVKAEVDLLVDKGWAIRRAEYDMTAAGVMLDEETLKQLKVETTIAYGQDQEGVPVPSRVSFVDGIGQVKCDFDQVRLGVDTPAEEFTLSRYGLPEINQPAIDAPRSYLPYLLYGIAAVSFVGAVLIFKRAG